VTFAPEDLGTILVVGAHPDDETFLASGLLAAAVRAEQRVATVTATRGEEGSFDEERWPTAELGGVRETEMLAGLAVLGVTDHTWLDYYDGTCAQVSLEEGTKRVRAHIERLAPDTVLTFGPDGMTGHPDHKAVCAWTTAAFVDVGKPGATLHYATNTREWADEFAPVMNQFNVFMEPGTPPITPIEDLSIAYTLPADILELKLAAIECHLSQTEGMLEAFGRDFFRKGMATEYFRPADD